MGHIIGLAGFSSVYKIIVVETQLLAYFPFWLLPMLM
jgi:hypothetical protein